MLALALALLVRVEVLGLFHPHAATIATSHGVLRVRAVGDTVHEGVGPPLPFLKLPAPGSRERPLTVRMEKLGRRSFAGALEVRAQAGTLHFFNEVPLEEYVASVVGAEMPGAPLEAQKALAVVARSFALHAAKHGTVAAASNGADLSAGETPGGASVNQQAPRSPALAHAGAPVCDTTHCQLYAGLSSADKSARDAAAATEGLVLLLPNGNVAPALHHAACGGRTSTAREVWPHASDDDELASAAVDDKLPDGSPACAPNPDQKDPPLEWHATIDERELAHALGASLPLSLRIDRGPDGRVLALSANGKRTLGADELHLALGRALGWNRIRSSRIYLWSILGPSSEDGTSHDLSQRAHPQVSGSPARFAVRGSGYGHGVGLCQRGAVRWSRAGEEFRRILFRYFPKLTVGRLPMTPDPG